jgi:hypothetical protein
MSIADAWRELEPDLVELRYRRFDVSQLHLFPEEPAADFYPGIGCTSSHRHEWCGPWDGTRSNAVSRLNYRENPSDRSTRCPRI